MVLWLAIVFTIIASPAYAQNVLSDAQDAIEIVSSEHEHPRVRVAALDALPWIAPGETVGDAAARRLLERLARDREPKARASRAALALGRLDHLRADTARAQQLLELDRVLVVDGEGFVRSADRGACEIFGNRIERKNLGSLAPASGLEAFVRDARELGREGVLAVVCDSTNAFREGTSPSETEVAASLLDIIKDLVEFR